jgi:hypothetical protein
MTEQVRDNKSLALEDLFNRVTRVVEGMGGAATATTVRRSFESVIVAGPRSEEVSALHAEMSDTFHVEFAPSRASTAPGVLSVKGKRTHGGSRTSGTIRGTIRDRREGRFGTDEVTPSSAQRNGV